MTMEWDRALALCEEALGCGDALVEASARHIEGLTHWFRGAPLESRVAFAQAEAVLAGLPDDHPPAFLVVLIGLPVVHDFGTPRVVHEETLATFRHCGPRQAEGYLRMDEAQFARFDGDHDRAQALAARAVARFRSLGDRRGTALALGRASCVARSRGDPATARELLAESNELRRATGDTRLIGMGIGLEGLLEAVAGDPARARALFTAVEERFIRQGDTPGHAGALQNHGTFELAQGRFESARSLLERSAAGQRLQRLRRTMAWTQLALAEALAALGSEPEAHALLEEAEAEMQRLGEPGGAEGCAALQARLQSLLSSH
jgi:tetratricopeptide (TPR) repeat protein